MLYNEIIIAIISKDLPKTRKKITTWDTLRSRMKQNGTFEREKNSEKDSADQIFLPNVRQLAENFEFCIIKYNHVCIRYAAKNGMLVEWKWERLQDD